MKIIALLCTFSFIGFCRGQNFTPSDSCVVNSNVKYEINYYVSGGNINSLRLLADGLLLKRINEKGNVERKFLKINKLNYFAYLEIQLYIDSVLWNDSLILSQENSIAIIGMSEVIQILQTDDLEFRVFYLKSNESAVIDNLIVLINNYLPQKYRKKYRIPDFNSLPSDKK